MAAKQQTKVDMMQQLEQFELKSRDFKISIWLWITLVLLLAVPMHAVIVVVSDTLITQNVDWTQLWFAVMPGVICSYEITLKIKENRDAAKKYLAYFSGLDLSVLKLGAVSPELSARSRDVIVGYLKKNHAGWSFSANVEKNNANK